MNYAALKTLAQTHPQWATATNAEVADWCNEEAFNADKTALSNEEILAVILSNRAEFSALSDTNKQIVRDILYVGDSVPTAAGEPARDTLVAIFGAGSATISALAASISYPISRAANAGILGQVTAGDIQAVRN